MLNFLKMLTVVVSVSCLSAELLADRLSIFSGAGELTDSESGFEDYKIVLQILNDGRGLQFHWFYRDDQGQQNTRNCFYLKEYFGNKIEVLAPPSMQSCSDISSYQTVGWGHSLGDDREHGYLLSYRSGAGGRFAVSLWEDVAKDHLRFTGHYINSDGELAQHWVDNLKFVH